MIPGHQEAPTGIYQGRHGYWGEVPLASWPQRAGSYLIDQAIGLAPLLLVLLARGDLGGVLWKPFFPLPWSALIAPPAVSLLCLMLWFANTCVLGGHTGRSVGKRVLGTSVYLQRLADHGDTAAGTSVAGRPQIPDRRWCRPEWRASVKKLPVHGDTGDGPGFAGRPAQALGRLLSSCRANLCKRARSHAWPDDDFDGSSW
jgi:hypothetical protein